MKNHLITAAAFLCAVATVLLERLIQPAALLLIHYIDTTFAGPRPALAVVSMPVAIDAPVKPAPKKRATKARSTRKRTSRKIAQVSDDFEIAASSDEGSTAGA